MRIIDPFDSFRDLKISTSELWKNEKQEYRLWVFSALACFLVFTVANLIILPLIIINWDFVVERVLLYLSRGSHAVTTTVQEISKESQLNNFPIDQKSIINQGYATLIFIQTTKVVLALTITTIFAYSVFSSYKKKDFAHLSQFAIISYHFVAIYYLINLLVTLSRNSFSSPVYNSEFASFFPYSFDTNTSSLITVKIISWIVQLLVIITSFIFFRKVTKIRMRFVLAKRASEVSKFISRGMNDPNGFNPLRDLSFGRNPFVNSTQSRDDASFNNINEEKKSREANDNNKKRSEERGRFSYLSEDFLKSATFKKIVSLKRQQLNLIAKKLSIFEYQKLDDEKILKQILLIYEGEWQKQKQS